jgi:hypothetical protein
VTEDVRRLPAERYGKKPADILTVRRAPKDRDDPDAGDQRFADFIQTVTIDGKNETMMCLVVIDEALKCLYVHAPALPG